jgi:hypothetical protein
VSFLSFIRQYGAREYGVTLAIAAIAGLALAVLINSASGGAGDTALLRTAPEPAAKTSPAPVTRKVYKPVRKTRPASKHSARHHHRRHRAHRSSVARVVSPAPVVQPTESGTSTTPTSTTPTTTTAAPVVRTPAAAPRPAPKPAPSRKGGGGIQFDDSG